MSPTDEELLKAYWTGWDECASGVTTSEPPESDMLMLTAYHVGWHDFVLGTEARSVDYQSDRNIIKRVRGCWFE